MAFILKIGNISYYLWLKRSAIDNGSMSPRKSLSAQRCKEQVWSDCDYDY